MSPVLKGFPYSYVIRRFLYSFWRQCCCARFRRFCVDQSGYKGRLFLNNHHNEYLVEALVLETFLFRFSELFCTHQCLVSHFFVAQIPYILYLNDSKNNEGLFLCWNPQSKASHFWKPLTLSSSLKYKSIDLSTCGYCLCFVMANVLLGRL